MLHMHKSEKVQEKHKTIQQKRAKERPSKKTNKGLEEERVKRGHTDSKAKEQRAKKGQKGQRATDRARP